MISLGLQQAQSTFVGQEIGKNDIKEAKQYFKTTKDISFLILVTTSLIVFGFRHQILSLFINPDKESASDVYKIAEQISALAILGKFFDLWQVMLQGAVRALGIQKHSANQNLIAYWIINLPLCFMLSFYFDYGLIGLYYSITIAQFYLAIALTIMIETADW